MCQTKGDSLFVHQDCVSVGVYLRLYEHLCAKKVCEKGSDAEIDGDTHSACFPFHLSRGMERLEHLR